MENILYTCDMKVKEIVIESQRWSYSRIVDDKFHDKEYTKKRYTEVVVDGILKDMRRYVKVSEDFDILRQAIVVTATFDLPYVRDKLLTEQRLDLQRANTKRFHLERELHTYQNAGWIERLWFLFTGELNEL